MQDSNPVNDEDKNKYWLTIDSEGNHGLLYEYPDQASFKAKSNVNIHRLRYNFTGNSQVIYNGSFYYYTNQMKKLIKYDLKSKTNAYLDQSLDKLSNRLLYKVQHNHLDIMADENGLWIILPTFDNLPQSVGNNTFVIKFDSISMMVEKVWNIKLDHYSKGDMFIICGVLYAIESVQQTYTNIDVAFDLYKQVNLKLSSSSSSESLIDFINPFASNYMISYNHRTKKLYAWDQGNLIDYPIKFTDS